jgi:hypothetical protein
VVAVDDRRPGALEVPTKQRPPLDKREPAHILVADVEEIEGI